MPKTKSTASTAPTVQQQGLVVFAKNKKRVSAFYAQVLQLEVLESATTHDLLRGGSYEVVVHAIPRRIAATITVPRPPTPREDTPFKPSFIVPSLDAARDAAQATGGFLKPAQGAWHFRGCTVIDGWDPEGNVVQLKQRDHEG
jgi:predicted enzyme related to lactoylglutathione lyase